MRTTSISWAERTINPWTGCWKTSAGCAHCYAERMSLRQNWSETPWARANIANNLRYHPERLQELCTKRPSRWFVCSMSDFMLEEVPHTWRKEALQAMRDNPQHTYIILTKRPQDARFIDWPDSVWFGVSVENRREMWRIDVLRQVEAKVRWISFEPLLEDLGMVDLSGVHWAVVGGESGPSYRPMDHAWARGIRDQCAEQGVAFYFKQSAAYKSEQGTELIEADGTRQTWRQYPGDVKKVESRNEQMSLF